MNFRRINVEMVGDIAVAALPDHKVIDEENIQMLSSELNLLVEIEGRRKLIVDFCKIDYYSDAALGKLITLDKKMKAAQGKLRFCLIHLGVYEAFAITRLNKLFDIRENREQALAGL